MRPILAPAFLALMLVLPAAAAETPAPPAAPDFESQLRQAEEMARRGISEVLGSVDLLLRALPRYELPEITENGDIILRRKPPPPAPRSPETGTI
jgi:hypothetical protein